MKNRRLIWNGFRERRWVIRSFLILFTALYSCNEWNDHYGLTDTDRLSIFEIMKMEPACSEFVAAAEATGYDRVLQGAEIFTVLIPPSGTFEGIEGDALKSLIANHILFSRYFDENFTDSLKVRSFGGKFYRLRVDEGEEPYLSNNRKEIHFTQLVHNLEGRNGVAHSIDEALHSVPNILDLISQLNPSRYSIFLENYALFDSINDQKYDIRFAINEMGEVIVDTVPFIVHAAFNPADEEKEFTLIVPSDDVIRAQWDELILKNGGNAARISDYYLTRLIRNQVLIGNYNRSVLLSSDTIPTEGGQWVVGSKLVGANLNEGTSASNGYLFESDRVIYKPIAADFIDSIVFEPEWAVGFDGHERTIIYSMDNEPIVSGDGVSVNYHLYAYGLNTGNRFNIMIPDVFQGLYEVKLIYKPSQITISLFSEKRRIAERLNMETLVPVDPNNTDPNFFANSRVGFVYLPEDGYLDLEFYVDNGIFSTLPIDKIVLVPLEF